MQIIETHCHLDYLKKAPLDEILTLSKEAGVEKILTISVEPENFDTVFKLSKKYSEIYFTQGIHPHDAIKANEDAFQIITQRCSEKKMLAVGEIGLDYHYNHSPRETQIEVFKRQLQIAIDNNKPVVIHSREADEDMINILSEYGPKLSKKGVIHSFTSTKDLALKAIELDFYIGFNGIITFKNAGEVRDVLALVPIEKILVETDAPFLAPVPKRGRENSPANLPFIIEKIAEVKDLPTQEVAKTVYKNSIDLFKF